MVQFPRDLLGPASAYSLEATRWAAVLRAFVFFGFLRFADEVQKVYRPLASTISKHFGHTTFSESVVITDEVDLSLHFSPAQVLIHPLSSVVNMALARRSVFRFL